MPLALAVTVLAGVVWWSRERVSATSTAGSTSAAPPARVVFPREWSRLDGELARAGPDRLQRDTGVAILVAESSWRLDEGINGSAVSPTRLRASVLVVVAELRRFPSAFLRRCALTSVVLVETLRQGNSARAGFASAPHGALVLDTRYDASAVRNVLDHEIYHLFDKVVPSEPSWTALNPAGVSYAPRLGLARDPHSPTIDPTRYGFVSRYAMTSAPEDRAETFSFLLTHSALVRRAAANDRVLTAKLELLEKTVVSAVPEMKDRFDQTRD